MITVHSFSLASDFHILVPIYIPIHMRLVSKLLRRRREILRFEITEFLLSVMGQLSTYFFSNCDSLPIFKKQSILLCEVLCINPRPAGPLDFSPPAGGGGV